MNIIWQVCLSAYELINIAFFICFCPDSKSLVSSAEMETQISSKFSKRLKKKLKWIMGINGEIHILNCIKQNQKVSSNLREKTNFESLG